MYTPLTLDSNSVTSVAAPPTTSAPTPARPQIRGRYDNAQTTPENQRQWRGVDYLSAKAANSFGVRRTLRMRSRHEVSNNPYLFGVCNGNADDLIDTGPTLQVRTSDAAYNREVEAAWKEWCDEVDLVEKLRTCKLAKTVDGEGFLVLKTVADLEQPVKLYPCDIEADQVTTPAPTNLTELWIDGLTLHPVTGKPTAYHVLKSHPGDFFFPNMNPLAVEKCQARHVIHWFGKFRPGQVRGVPAFTSSLDLFTELRAYRKAVLKAAEVAADLSAVAESDYPADSETPDDEVVPFKAVPTQRGMIVTLPAGMKLSQFDPKQPTTNYADYHEHGVGEACRPLAYPVNLALGTSQKFNFSSAKLDHINYRNSLRVERDDCGRVVLRKLFRAWFEEAVLCGAVRAWNGLNVPPVEWHWPGFTSIDPVADGQADIDALAAGTLTYREFWGRRGYDWQDVLKQQAAERAELEKFGLTFGEPVKRTISDDADETASGDHGHKADHERPREGEPKESPDATDGGKEKVEKVPATNAPKASKASKAGAAKGAEVQDTALNGAQIASLLAIADKVVLKEYPADSATAIIEAAFPVMDRDLIKRFVSGLSKAPKPEPSTTDPADARARSVAALEAANVA